MTTNNLNEFQGNLKQILYGNGSRIVVQFNQILLKNVNICQRELLNVRSSKRRITKQNIQK